MKTKFISIAAISSIAIVAACSGGTDADDLNNGPATGGTSANGGSPTGQGGSGLATSTGGLGAGGSTTPIGTGGSGNSTFGGSPASGGSTSPGTGGSTTAAGAGGSGATVATGGVSNGGAMQTTGGGGGGEPPATGGTGGGGGGGAGAGGSSGGTGPYAPRTGSFKMLVYPLVAGTAYNHPSIPAGVRMVQNIAKKQGFEAVVATNDSEITPEGLAKYEIVFHLNSTGELFQGGTKRKDYEDWIRKNGAFAGMHGATDSGQSWEFYKEITGQYYDLHDPCCANAQIQWTAAGQTHPAGKGLPNPWSRSEEWYKFNRYSDWSTKAGFTVLNTVQTGGGGTRPVSFVREWGNFRAFYTSIGHEDGPYSDADVIKHVTQGIMWAVRREALIVP
jgi:type 1 glutamine amidotransferase